METGKQNRKRYTLEAGRSSKPKRVLLDVGGEAYKARAISQIDSFIEKYLDPHSYFGNVNPVKKVGRDFSPVILSSLGLLLSNLYEIFPTARTKMIFLDEGVTEDRGLKKSISEQSSSFAAKSMLDSSSFSPIELMLEIYPLAKLLRNTINDVGLSNVDPKLISAFENAIAVIDVAYSSMNLIESISKENDKLKTENDQLKSDNNLLKVQISASPNKISSMEDIKGLKRKGNIGYNDPKLVKEKPIIQPINENQKSNQEFDDDVILVEDVSAKSAIERRSSKKYVIPAKSATERSNKKYVTIEKLLGDTIDQAYSENYLPPKLASNRSSYSTGVVAKSGFVDKVIPSALSNKSNTYKNSSAAPFSSVKVPRKTAGSSEATIPVLESINKEDKTSDTSKTSIGISTIKADLRQVKARNVNGENPLANPKGVMIPKQFSHFSPSVNQHDVGLVEPESAKSEFASSKIKSGNLDQMQGLNIPSLSALGVRAVFDGAEAKFSATNLSKKVTKNSATIDKTIQHDVNLQAQTEGVSKEKQPIEIPIMRHNSVRGQSVDDKLLDDEYLTQILHGDVSDEIDLDFFSMDDEEFYKIAASVASDDKAVSQQAPEITPTMLPDVRDKSTNPQGKSGQNR